ncbi:hypothetical protein [Modestobacter sp. DSM 44400]|uniref:hypothetical protein n=1 Tax=Modestobacter sp. DSM 44400 TaxID=1550230 RepID=UPI0020C8F8E4|nr:hypothetical protein [Modestobacter sp. DSM 44400]
MNMSCTVGQLSPWARTAALTEAPAATAAPAARRARPVTRARAGTSAICSVNA